MTVYIEYVIINNLIIDFLLLKATFIFTGNPYKGRRLFLCAFLGAIISLVFPLVSFGGVLLTCLKVMSGLLIILLASRYKGLNGFVKCAVIFFCLTFLSGGAMYGIYNLFGVTIGTEFVAIFTFLPVYLIIKLARKVFVYLSKRANAIKLCYEVKLFYKDKSIKARGFLDTGNNLYDKENAVILCSSEFAKEFLGDSIINVKFNKITLSTVAGQSLNPSFRLDKFILYIGEKEHIFNYVTVCIANLKTGDYQIILHPALIKEQGIESNRFFEKVS